MRYRGPNGSHGNVAEIELQRSQGDGNRLRNTWSNSGSTFDKALDEDVNTFFDAPNADGNFVGIDDTQALPFQTDRIRYYPREGFENGMRGGVFEGTNGDPVTGPYVKLTEITDRRQLELGDIFRSSGVELSISTLSRAGQLAFHRRGGRVLSPGSQGDRNCVRDIGFTEQQRG